MSFLKEVMLKLHNFEESFYLQEVMIKMKL